MKIYFNQVPDTDVEFFGDSGIFGPNDADNFFYNYVEFGSNAAGFEEVVVADGCDRMVPINMDAVPDLVEALNKAYELWLQIKMSEKLVQIAENPDVEMYVEDNEITFSSESVQNAVSNA